MVQTLEAATDERGPSVCWSPWSYSCRAVVTTVGAEVRVPADERALLSEAVLAEDWNRPEEVALSPSTLGVSSPRRQAPGE